jgi:hypothetical protein
VPQYGSYGLVGSSAAYSVKKLSRGGRARARARSATAAATMMAKRQTAESLRSIALEIWRRPRRRLLVSEMNAGNRNKLFGLIEEVEGAGSFEELRDRLIPVLNVLACYAIQSEAVVNEDNEAWHDDYARKLRNETREAAAAQSQQGADPRQNALPRAPSARPPHEPGRRRQAEVGRRNQRPSRGAPPPATSPRADPAGLRGAGISSRLLAIMNGVHPSLDSDGE